MNHILREAWKYLNLTVEEGVLELASINTLLQEKNRSGCTPF